MKRLHHILLALGAAGFAFLVWRIGPKTLWGDVIALGFGAVVIISVAAVEQLLHTLGWQRCFDRDERPGLWRLYGAHLAGGAINIVTPTATLGGELVRGGLLGRLPGAAAAASVTVDRLAYALADTTLGACGLVVVLVAAPLGLLGRLGVIAAAALFVTGVGMFWALQRDGRLLTRVTGSGLVRRFGGAALAEGLHSGSIDVDARIAAFHAGRTGSLLAAYAFHAAGSLMGAVQLGLFFHYMHAPATVAMTLAAFLVSIALDLFSFFIPARLGAQEGARMLAVSLVGLPPALGLVFSLVLRAEQVVWAAIGLGLYPLLVPRRVDRRARPGPAPAATLTPGDEAG